MTNKALEKVNSVLAEPSLYSMTTTKEGFLGFYFLEISTLQVLKFLPNEEILNSKIFLENTTDNSIEKIKSTKTLTAYISEHPEYYMQDVQLILKNGIEITSHDDGEICIYFPKEQDFRLIITNLLISFSLPSSKVLSLLESNPNKYISLTDSGDLVKVYQTFDEFLSDK